MFIGALLALSAYQGSDLISNIFVSRPEDFRIHGVGRCPRPNHIYTSKLIINYIYVACYFLWVVDIASSCSLHISFDWTSMAFFLYKISKKSIIFLLSFIVFPSDSSSSFVIGVHLSFLCRRGMGRSYYWYYVALHTR